MLPTLQELDALQAEGHPSIMGRLLQGLANQPAEKVTGLMKTLEATGVQPASGEIPKPFDIAPPTDLSEQLTDIGANLAGEVPFLVAGSELGGATEVPALSRMLSQAGAFGLSGATSSPEEAAAGAGLGTAFGGIESIAPGWTKAAAAAALGVGTGIVSRQEGANPAMSIGQGSANALLSYFLGGKGRVAPIPSRALPGEAGPGAGMLGTIGSQRELPLGPIGPKPTTLEPWEVAANDAKSLAAERARPTIGTQPNLPFPAPEGALIREPAFTEGEANRFATVQQGRIPTELALGGNGAVRPLEGMMRSNLVREATYSPEEAATIARFKAGPSFEQPDLPFGAKPPPSFPLPPETGGGGGGGGAAAPHPPKPTPEAGGVKFSKVALLDENEKVIAEGPLATTSHQDLIGKAKTDEERLPLLDAIASDRNVIIDSNNNQWTREQLAAAGFPKNSQDIRADHPDLVEGIGKKKVGEVPPAAPVVPEEKVATSQLSKPRYESQIGTKGAQISEGDVEALKVSNARRLTPPTEEELASLEVTPAAPQATSYQPAVSYRGETFTGKSHPAARDKLEAKYPNFAKGAEKPVSGFLTPTGFKTIMQIAREKLNEGGFISPQAMSAITRYVALPTIGAIAGYTLDEKHRWGSAVAGALGMGAIGFMGKRAIALLTKDHPPINPAKAGVPQLSRMKAAMGEDVRDYAKELVDSSTMGRRLAARWGWSNEYEKLARWVDKNIGVDLDATRLREKAWGMAEDLSNMMREAVMDLHEVNGIEAHFDTLNSYFEGGMTQSALRAAVENDDIANLAALAMQSRTRLQEIIIAGLGESNLSKKIQASVGSYLTTTYRIFHDPKYYPTDVQIEAAARSLQKMYGGTLESSLIDVRGYLHRIKAEQGMFFKGSGGETLSGILHRAQDITPEFQEMLGIYKNPLERMGFTGIKLVQAARSAEYFNEVARGVKSNGLRYAYSKEEYLNKVAALQNTLKYSTDEVEIAKAQDQLLQLRSYVKNTMGQNQGRLADKYMDVRMHDQLANYDASMRMFANPFMRGMAETTNTIKYGQIILSPLQFVRQIYQLPLLGMMARTSPADWGKAFETLVTDKSEAGIAERARLRKIGVFAGDPVGGMLRRDMRAMIDGTLDALLTEKVKKGLRNWEEIWRTPDLIIRTSAFQRKEAELLSQGLSAIDAENGAIDHMNRYTMNYAAVPPIVVKGRQLPFINQYLSFSYEMMRLTKNHVQDALKGDPYSMGVLAGLTTIPFIIQQMTESQLKPEDKAEWDKVKNLGPAYSRDNFRFVVGRLPNGDFRYVDFTPLVLHAPWLSTLRAVMSGDREAALAVNPVFGWENTPILNVLSTGVTGRNRHSGEQLYTTFDYLDSIRRDVAPLLIGTELDRIKDALTKNAEGGIGIINQRTGQSNSISDILQAYLTSMRPYTIKPDYIKMQATNEARDRIRQQQIYARRVLNTNASEDVKSRARDNYGRAVEQILLDYQQKLGLQVSPETVTP